MARYTLKKFDEDWGFAAYLLGFAGTVLDVCEDVAHIARRATGTVRSFFTTA